MISQYCRNRGDKKQMRMIYQHIGFDKLFPSTSLAFCSGAASNIIYQSCLSLYRYFLYLIHPELQQTITCGMKNVFYAGIVTSSYMLSVFLLFVINSYIKNMHCGDFSFNVDLLKRYLGGYMTGVTAVLYLSSVEAAWLGMRNGWKQLSWSSLSSTFKLRLLTVAPLVMMQQSFYDHLRILEEPYFAPS